MREGWEEYKLDDIGSFKNGANFSSDKMGSGIPLVNVKDITDSPLLHPERMDLVEIDISSKSGSAYLAKEGDIFFVRSSVKRSGVGAVGMLKNNDSKVVHCGFVIRFRLTSELILPRFAFYLFNTSFNREKVRNVSGGATIVNISQGSLKMLKFKFPPLNTQRKIASILSAYDNLIENNLKRIKLLEEQAQLTYEEWFVRFKFPGHETTKFNEETGLPEGWEKKKIEDVIEVGRGSSPRPISNQKYFEGGTIPWLKIADATSSHIYIYETKLYVNDYGASFSRKLPKGSIVVAASGTLGFPMILGVEACIHDGWLYFKGIEENLKEYFYFSFIGLKAYFESISYGAAIQNINTGIVRQSPFIVPSPKVILKFKNIASKIFKSISNLQNQNQHLKEARDILLPRLMSGMIDVEKLEVGSLKYEVNDSLGMVAEENSEY